ncbi:hypothetical protein VTL71DRAFT_1669 [Oculimacula yallundae]|uniref:Uncharacterized protein n=1 Tax=Oculimacula yallundae TaxID=86028 RepID=A0ABR4CBE2_9HELO
MLIFVTPARLSTSTSAYRYALFSGSASKRQPKTPTVTAGPLLRTIYDAAQDPVDNGLLAGTSHFPIQCLSGIREWMPCYFCHCPVEQRTINKPSAMCMWNYRAGKRVILCLAFASCGDPVSSWLDLSIGACTFFIYPAYRRQLSYAY